MKDDPNSVIVSAIAFLGLLLTGSIAPRDEPSQPPMHRAEVRTAGDQVVAHAVLSSVADDMPALDQLESVRYAELTLTPEPCR